MEINKCVKELRKVSRDPGCEVIFGQNGLLVEYHWHCIGGKPRSLGFKGKVPYLISDETHNQLINGIREEIKNSKLEAHK